MFFGRAEDDLRTVHSSQILNKRYGGHDYPRSYHGRDGFFYCRFDCGCYVIRQQFSGEIIGIGNPRGLDAFGSCQKNRNAKRLV